MPVLSLTCEYKRVKHYSILADVRLPKAQRPLAVIYIHGGALISGLRREMQTYQAQRLLQAGFAVVSIAYRLAPRPHWPRLLWMSKVPSTGSKANVPLPLSWLQIGWQ